MVLDKRDKIITRRDQSIEESIANIDIHIKYRMTLNFVSKVIPVIQNLCPQANIVSKKCVLRQKEEFIFEGKSLILYIDLMLTFDTMSIYQI